MVLGLQGRKRLVWKKEGRHASNLSQKGKKEIDFLSQRGVGKQEIWLVNRVSPEKKKKKLNSWGEKKRGKGSPLAKKRKGNRLFPISPISKEGKARHAVLSNWVSRK